MAFTTSKLKKIMVKVAVEHRRLWGTVVLVNSVSIGPVDTIGRFRGCHCQWSGAANKNGFEQELGFGEGTEGIRYPVDFERVCQDVATTLQS